MFVAQTCIRTTSEKDRPASKLAFSADDREIALSATLIRLPASFPYNCILLTDSIPSGIEKELK